MNVRFGSLADIAACLRDAAFAPKGDMAGTSRSNHQDRSSVVTVWFAMSALPRKRTFTDSYRMSALCHERTSGDA